MNTLAMSILKLGCIQNWRYLPYLRDLDPLILMFTCYGTFCLNHKGHCLEEEQWTSQAWHGDHSVVGHAEMI
jgi:hypothetical protein